LQELHLTVVDERECARLVNASGVQLSVDVDLELCAGKKNYLPRYPVYTRVERDGKVIKFGFQSDNFNRKKSTLFL